MLATLHGLWFRLSKWGILTIDQRPEKKNEVVDLFEVFRSYFGDLSLDDNFTVYFVLLSLTGATLLWLIRRYNDPPHHVKIIDKAL